MRLGFAGVGWIGKHRMEALAAARLGTIAAIADPSRERREAALAIAPEAHACEHLGQLLELPLDGIVIATPSGLHAEHAIAALERGRAVFCQKPLGRTGAETRRVVETARARDRLLGVDLSYRHTAAIGRMREAVADLGRIFAIDLVFHNAYGPDAPWFYDKAQSGGGCVIDLGVHLVDLAMGLLDGRALTSVDSRLFAGGRPARADEVEDYAAIQLRFGDTVVRLACSWRISAGRDAVIETSVYGTHGAVAMKNVDGSFYDFVAERYRGTATERLASPPDAWGGRAIVAWAERLARDPSFDREAERYVEVARVLDAIYAEAACGS